MKKLSFICLLLLCPLYSNQAAILNGFSQEKMILEKKIESLYTGLQNGDCEKICKKLKRQLKKLQKEYDLVQKRFIETQWLIQEVQIIDPELYHRVSIISNSEGTLTHVYVRYVHRHSKEFTYFVNNYFEASAYTSVGQTANNPNVCESLYGVNSITITVGKGCNELIALGHEFAHVIYIVPNLREYLDFYERHYNCPGYNMYRRGHSPYDPGNKIICQIEESYRIKYKEYQKEIKKSSSGSTLVSKH